MGRSKFPGKPPKTVTRKRIKVLGQPETVQSDSVTVAENIYYGLSLFNETFGDNEKEHPPFHGFSTKEANLSVSYVKTQQHDTEKGTVKSPPDAAENPIPKSNEQNVTDTKNSPPSTETNTEQLCDKNIEPATDIKKDETIVNSKCASKFHRSKNRRSCKNIKFSNFMKTPVLKSVNNILDQHQRTRQLRNSTAKRLLQRAKSNSNNARNMTTQCGDKQNAVRKFILPVRSAHSSRVIKPNKRFIEELEEISGTEHSENEIGTHAKKAKFVLNKFCNQDPKLKEGTISKLCTKLKDKEVRNKTKKVVIQSVKSCEKLAPSVQDAQVLKIVNTDVKKNNVSNKNKALKSPSDESSSTQDCSQNTIRKAQNLRLTTSKSQKPISVPTKVLPDSDVPSSESSRIQTRSGTQSEVTDPQVETNSEDTVKLKEDTSAKNQGNSDNGNKTAEGNSDNFDTESTLSESGSEHSNHTEDEQSEWTGMKLNGGKVILRKARLKLDNKCVGGTEGPFSTTNNNNVTNGNTNLGLTGTIKCGVCGAVRFYRFVKQARKFGIHSCESCRKFISKMIKRQACAKSTNSILPVLQCHKGDGLCLVPPVVRSQQWNLMRCVYKARCPACWLKMCLKCYNIPSSLRTGLNALLPPMMRDPLSIPLLLNQEDNDNQGQKLTSCKLDWPAEDSSEKNLFKSAMSWRNIEMGQKTSYQGTAGFLYTKLDKFDSSLNISPSKKRRKNNRIKVRKKIKNPMFSSPSINQCPQPLRQRLELKGPRVKHVCRSASVALGQPIATFPSIDGKEDTESNKHIPKTLKESDRIEKKDCAKEKELQKHNDENTVNATQQSHLKRGKTQQNMATSNFQTVSKTNTDTLHTVSIDFWEQYDPTEVGAKGFALIGSELFHIPAICYLCGSAGKEPLIHCQCCCEPYHAFCLEPSEWNACAQPNWCCPRCTICQSCHLRSGPKLSCIRCRQSFHHSCLSKSGVSARLYSPERPFVCQSCVKCKSCGSEGVNFHVGNLPLCSMCFKLRQQGNYCPLCQRCYNENDFDAKMMECSECSYWVHSRCEGLSDERYQVLSYLPDSIEFTCSQCSSNPNSIWRNAIEAELKAGFIGVIKALSKNRKACAALKWSPRKECLCKPIPNIRRLDFSSEKTDSNTTNTKEIQNIEGSEECNNDKSKDTESGLKSNSKSDVTSRQNEDQPTDCSNRRGLRRLRQKFHLKECSVRVKNCALKDIQDNEKKDSAIQENSSINLNDTECHCSDQQIIVRPSPTLMSVKRKVNNNEYKTLLQFHCDMEHVINCIGTKELIDAYHDILQEVFPWFSPKNTKSSNGKSDPVTLAKDNNKDNSPSIKFGDSVLEVWKEEVMKTPKAIATKTANLYNVNVEDSRSCCLCKGLGDGQETKEGRLLYCGQNEWVHSNCALWSNEVFEEIDGSLQNVHNAISRGRLIRCSECGKKGASIGCCAKNCSNTFHYPCARNIGLAFNDDKTVFCSLHLSNCSHKTLQNESEFSLRRPVYVELDRKKKKYAEPSKVKVMIGSLMIDCLGSVMPEYSDAVEKLIPCDYKCSRLYWSTVNPLKIVRYYIRTYVQVYLPEFSPDLENNVTIDHSKEEEKEDILDTQKTEYLAVKQTLDALIDTVCNKEVDENLAEQNNTDLLPPELKEAIFEDLPHDLLDGISMQDIFPKMTYEDFLAMDLKNDGTFATDLFKDDMLASEVDEIIKPPENKISKVDPSLLEVAPHNDLWVHLETKTSVQDLMDDLLNSKNQKRGGRELKRSKSEVMSNSPLIVGGQRHHQRSCSLTWSCKLDNPYGPAIKRRKLSRNSSMAKSNETSVMVLDSQNERPPTLHELRIPDSIMVTVGRANTPNILSDSMRELKYCIEDANSINRRILSTNREETKEHKRLFWHARQQPRILQVDGPADPSSASECSSPEYNVEENTTELRVPEHLSIPQLDGINDESSCDSSEFTLSVEKDINTKASNNILRSKRIYGFIRSHIAKNNDKPQKVKEGDNFLNSSKFATHKINFFRENNLKLNVEIPQLDGADDISSDDECISPQHTENERHANVTSQYDIAFDHIDRPVTCKRCRCTYRTQDSYNRHLTHCDIMITSDSDSETMDNKLTSPDSRFSPSIGSVSPQFITLSPSEGHTLSSDYPDMQATSPLEASVPSPHPAIQIEPIAQAIITPQIHTHATVETVHQTVLTSNDMIVQTQYTRTTTTLPNATVLPQESTVQITEITDPPSVASDSSITQNMISTPINSPGGASSQTVPSPQVSPTFSSTGVQTAGNESHANIQTIKLAKSKSPRAPKSRTKGIKTQIVKNTVQPPNGHPRFQPLQNNTPVIQLQQAQRPSAPTVILQQVASPSIMSAYVETLQQQSGQNLQYVTTIGGQHETAFKPQFITTNHLVPGAYIQTPSDNLLALQNGGISILPGVQIAQTQPTVLGTIIQQQPSAIQCGVISSEQLLLSSTPTLEMFTDSTGSMFLSNQPMYYGLETIVSNTVMSSSQFMTGTVPQVLASSYQTTTQVFQASKLMEPIVDVQAVPGIPTVTAMQTVQNVPGVPGVPTVPNVANVPNVSNVPNIASIPSVTNVPNVPNVPTIPTIPAVSSVSTVSNIANITNIPSVSNVPTIPNVPSVPSIPNAPSIPNIPSASSISSIPSAPSIPNLPSMPNITNIPNAPTLPGTSNIPTVPVQNVSNVPTLSSSVQSVGNVSNMPTVPSGYVVVNQSTPIAESVVTPQINIPATPERSFTSATCNTIFPVSCQSVVEPIASVQLPETCTSEPQATTRVTPSPKLLQNSIPTIPRVAVRPSPVSNSTAQLNNGPWKLTESLFGSEQIMSNSVQPYFDSKHVSENTSMIKSSISSKILPLPNHCITQRDIIVNKLNHDVNNVHNNYNSIVSNSNNINVSTSNNPVNASSTVQNKITMSTCNVPTSRPMNRVLPMQAVTPKQDTTKVTQKTDIIIEEPTKPVIKPAEPELEQKLTESKKQIVETVVPTAKKPETTISDINETLKLNTETIEKVKENFKLELDKEKLQNASLKIVLQKQLQDGSYKITHNMKAVAQNKKSPQVTSVEILPSKQVPQIASLQLLPIKTFTLKTNKVDEKVKPIDNKINMLKNKTPPVAVKKPRIVSKSIKSISPSLQSAQTQKSCARGPTLMYEIKSQDGFTHTASSMAEVWETVFQAVQSARKAHNLPPLPHNPLIENMGLENNATVYLVEQLPNVNKCSKYKAKFHNLAPPKTGETEGDLPKACDNGAARAEPFKGRKVHDMFSWLASRHRQQPKMIAISEAESSSLFCRRVASTNLPMAMRFRILKETSKESVGVYHSHIHGRGLFCLRDIEAGEMVIEYAGEVIRSSLTDKREKYYDSKNIGCYMFKIDDHLVVDATMKGNAARFINHSCEPNCYSRVVDILGKKHILIFALRRITQGEELTYDYKFPFEDIKIPCTCGSRRCRKYLN
ncbi:histone-lysine N-methyltransferase trithorax-like isoform X1 [Hylaeus volcanicus]|uniref:histone-lysine N-methyltransferase trithorax-like isoform X1 n=1 Tax=Hylaeus volcanicus TaxID=313075 RepID=UPI0023B83183|nr:histone-lysine N-methyltransferase trithorax-like isoform X1 [Hylaeus volcanicus]